MISITNCSNPWKDIASYDYKDASCFKGREKAIKKYLDIIDNGAFSVLYSASGIGKTSFIQAGIEPFMMNEQYVPIHIRFVGDDIYIKDGESIDRTIISIIETQLKDKGLSWVAPFEKWPFDLEKYHDGNYCKTISEESLWWRVYTYKIVDNTKTNAVLQPMLVFDQFEEVFINSKKHKTSQLLDKLFGLIEILSIPVLPSKIETIMNLLFEKGFRYKVKNERNFKVIFSLRKEYLSDFDNWTNDRYHISELLQNRMLLFPLSRSQAGRVITQQPLLDINGNIIPGEYTETLIHVKDLILEKLDVRHQNEIEPFLLSLLCSRLFETAYSNKQDCINEVDLEKYDIKTILGDFYQEKIDAIFNDKPADLENFENCIVDEDGFRNRIKSTKFPNVEFDNLYKEKLENSHIIRIEKYENDVEYVEFVHDMLCDIIKVRKKRREKINEIRRKNQQRVQDDLNVLTVRGRRLLDNTIDYGGFRNAMVESPIDEDRYIMDSLFDFNLRYLFHSNVKFDDFIKTQDNNHSLLLEYRNCNNEQARSVDGVSKYELYWGEEIKRLRPSIPVSELNSIIQNNKDSNPVAIYSTLRVHFIESIRKLSGYIDRPFYIQGYCGIIVKYETYTIPTSPCVVKKREIERTYLDENDNPVMTIDGYAMVKRHYDNEGNIDKVLFYDDKPTPQLCPHRNGNYGFISIYDIYGREIKRVFIDDKGKPSKVTSGIWGRKFEYDSDNRIIREINIGESHDIIRDKDGYCAVEYMYDGQSRISDEIYLDENLNKINGHNGYCITRTTYTTESDVLFLMEEKYFDKDGCEVCDPITKSSINRYSYDLWFRPVKYEFLNNNQATFPALFFNYENFKLSRITIQLGSQVVNMWIQLDKRNQYIEKMGYLDIWGRRTKDEGAYGKLFIRDERTLSPKGFLYLNKIGKPASNDAGVYEQRWHCREGKINSEMYFDIYGKPIADENGVYGRRYKYNLNGDCVKESFLGEDGETIENNINGYAHIITSYNSDRTKACVKFFDNRDVAVANKYGDFSLKYEHLKDNEFIEEKCISCDDKGVKHNNTLGFCTHVVKKDYLQREVFTQDVDLENRVVGLINKTDYYDNELKKNISYYDSEHHLTKGPEGWAHCFIQYDKRGRHIYSSYYDENDNLVPDTLGDFGTRYEYPDDNIVRILSLNSQNELYINPNGYAIREITYDELGREIRIRYYGVKEKSIIANDGRKGYIVKYLNDNSYVEICIDEFDEISEDKYGISRKLILQDKLGRRISELYFDRGGNPKRDSIHDFGTMYRYEDHKRFDTGLDSKGLPHKNKYGWVTCVKDNGSVTYLDEKNHKVGLLWQLLYWIGSSIRREKVVLSNHLMIRMSVEGDGYFRNYELEGNYLLLKYKEWSEGMPIDLLVKEFDNQDTESVEIQYLRLSSTFDGIDLGEINKRTFPKGKLGVRIKPIIIPEGLYKEIMLMWVDSDIRTTTHS